jgi:hypothetical protein
MGVEVIYSWNLQELKEVTVDDQLDLSLVRVALSAKRLQEASKRLVGYEVFKRIPAGVWRARPQVKITYHNL